MSENTPEYFPTQYLCIDKVDLERYTILFYFFIFAELDLSFPYREVTIKRGVDAKEIYEMVTEVGR